MMPPRFTPRASWRLRAYDYASPGPYFVTQSLDIRTPRFGSLTSELGLVHSAAGEMVVRTWSALPERFTHLELDAMVVMPDHIHGILTLRRTLNDGITTTLTDVMGVFRSRSTVEYIHGVRSRGWPAFDKPLWEPHFHDHVIRDERDMEFHRRYIKGNPGRWLERHG